MFSVMIRAMSATSPMAIARPASDMMFESTPSRYIARNEMAIDRGSVLTIARELRRWRRNTNTTRQPTINSSVKVSLSVPIVSRTIVVRS